ncbi:MAG: D-alanine--D-alanine ligase [Desulfobulbaceae bacterium]|nr:MAG: D-alanine--D-alanine ligase [Desulfobulbaceae bacterium]
MKIAIVHNRPVAAGGANWQSSQDVLRQVEAVERSLVALGISCLALPFDRDVGAFLAALEHHRIEAIFNLCESVDDDAQMVGHPAALFELLDLPFTGSGSLALMLTTDKLLAKRQLAAAGILTPVYRDYDGGDLAPLLDMALPAIIKPRLEDASIGIDQESIVCSREELAVKIPDFYRQYGPLLLEQFIDGREFNVSLFGYPEARVLPLAEIDFSAFPDDLQKIVGYRAKWDEDAFEYHNTNRLFPAEMAAGLSTELGRVALATYRLFQLRDYGRIDLRLDGAGRVHVLEANANPCLSPDAGFVAAAGQAGMSYGDMVGRFVSFLRARV